jgi:putative transposase
MQKYRPERIYHKRKRIFEFIVDETQVKVGRDFFWIWIAIELVDKTVLGVRISLERNMFVAEQFLKNLANEYGKHPLSTDGGTWYSQACKFLKIKHHIHLSHERSIIERTIQYVKDRTECFDDYFPCRKEKWTKTHYQLA